MRDTAEELASALHGAKIDTLATDLHKRIVTEIKPHKGGNEDIWNTHELDIADKHKLIIPVLQVTSIDGIIVEDQKGRVYSPTFTFIDTKGGHWFVTVPVDSQIKDKGYVATSVLFGNGQPCEGLEIGSTLQRFSSVILKVVELLEQL